jgi:hypothetical protein
MKSAFAFLLFCPQLGHAAADPIDMLVRRLNGSHGEWINGLYPTVRLASDAATDAVIEEAIAKTGLIDGRIERYTIISARSVSIDEHLPHVYYALLLDTNLGRKILLMRYEGGTTGWWTRFFDAG